MKRKYHFDKLEPGDSFIVELNPEQTIDKLVNTMNGCARAWSYTQSRQGQVMRTFRINKFDLSNADTTRPSYIRVTRIT
jgi:hypothetical protein